MVVDTKKMLFGITKKNTIHNPDSKMNDISPTEANGEWYLDMLIDSNISWLIDSKISWQTAKVSKRLRPMFKKVS